MRRLAKKADKGFLMAYFYTSSLSSHCHPEQARKGALKDLLKVLGFFDFAQNDEKGRRKGENVKRLLKKVNKKEKGKI